ncbi:membrane protein [Mycoplasmopsis canis]|uniref:putative immunoglobulin-blocking virulence protein n=1 Tax=Mycoplasmopsis canis TaxID=29555 RepID=UPI000624A7F2|nr:putative immunoglobulin-blocking virulence protein [Mycoplasmopsis canis]AKF41439.1 membrane protein [Mycoplasmopsis canis]
MINRKKKVILIASSIGLTAASIATTLVHTTSASTKGFKFQIDRNAKPNFESGDVDLTKSIISASDYNLPKKQAPEIVEPPKIVEPPTTIAKPIIKDPEKPQPIPKPVPEPITPSPNPTPAPKPAPTPTPAPKPTPIPVPPKPVEPPKPKKVKKLIKHGDIEFEADVIEIPEKTYDSSDIEKGITNRVPYTAEVTPDVTGVNGALTAENIKKTLGRAVNKAKMVGKHFSNDYGYGAALGNPNLDIAEKQNYIANDGNAPDHLGNLWARYEALLSSKENIKQYLNPTGLANLDKWWDMTETISWPRLMGTETRPLGKLLLLMNIDPDKITKLSKEVLDQLKNGSTIPNYGGDVYVNSNGEWVSRTFEPAVNKVTGEMTRNNKIKRVFGNNDYYWRSPDDIKKGKFANWTDRDVTSYYASRGLDVYGGGIKITEYTRNDVVEGATREKGVVVTLDVLEPNAYKKAEKLIKQLQEKNIEITGYRIENIGKAGSTQDMSKIFAALPNKLPLLELFFESRNTSALKYLRDKEIDELSLLTNNKVNSLHDEWAFNPWALNKVAWVNMADYNVSSSYNSWDTIYTRITFDNLAFDPENYTTEGDWSEINNGLRMAYWVRNNERIFQGGWGPGLKPDRDAAGNSYPMGVDFSRIPKIKTLRGMVFYDIKNPSRKRKLNKIKLYNDSDTWEVTTADLNLAQFDDVLVKNSRAPRSKIKFSNGALTKKIKIKPTVSVQNINGDGIRHLSTLMQYSDGNFSKSSTEIIVTDGAVQLYNTLKSAGFNVRYTNIEDEFEIF